MPIKKEENIFGLCLVKYLHFFKLLFFVFRKRNFFSHALFYIFYKGKIKEYGARIFIQSTLYQGRNDNYLFNNES